MTLRPMIPVLALLAALGLAADASAESLTRSRTVYPTLNNWNLSVSVEKFFPDYGHLNSVAVSVTGHYDGAFYNENLAAEPAAWTCGYLFETDVSLNDEMLVRFAADYEAQGELNEFDGSMDFGGPSGVVHPFMMPIAGSTVVQDGLQTFIGTGRVSFVIDSRSTPTMSQSRDGTQVAASRSSVTITVVYNYSPTAVSAETATWSEVKRLYR